jgi:hypothetical protein
MAGTLRSRKIAGHQGRVRGDRIFKGESTVITLCMPCRVILGCERKALGSSVEKERPERGVVQKLKLELNSVETEGCQIKRREVGAFKLYSAAFLRDDSPIRQSLGS